MEIIEQRWESLTNNMEAHTYRNLRLAFYAAAVIVLHLISGVYFQRIMKVPYQLNNGITDINGIKPTDLFLNPFGIPIFDNIFGVFVGYFTYQFMTNPTQNDSVPFVEVFKLSLFFYMGLLLLVVTSIQTSYITVSIINSCQLIIIVLLAVFLSKSSPRFRVQKRQIVTSGFLVIGIIIYQYFSHNKQGKINKNITWESGLLLLLLLLVGGYRPQIMAQIRDKYSPSPAYLQYIVSLFTLGMLIISSIISTHCWQLIKFIWNHDGLILDLCIQSFFFSLGQIFIFRAGIQYKQHITATIGVFRKLLSSLFSAIYFHHHLLLIQYVGILIIFGGLMIDIYLSYKEDDTKGKAVDLTNSHPIEPNSSLQSQNQQKKQITTH